MQNSIFFIFVVILLFSCSGIDEGLNLTKGTPEYEFAKALANKLSTLDPDSNRILITTNKFNITTGTIVDALFKNFNNKLDQLKNLNAPRLKKIFMTNAKAIGEKKMLLQAVEESGIEVSQTEIDSVMQIEFSKAGGKDKFIEYLTKKNITLDFVMEDFKNSLLIQKYLEYAVAQQTMVSENEIQEKMMEIRTVSVRHILLKAKDKSESEKAQIKKKMENILSQAQNGNDFAKLAHKYSEDTGSKENGGLYKNFNRGDMVKSFEDVAFSVPIGEISDIFETGFGYHILKVIDRKKDTRSAAQIKPELKKAKQDIEIPKHIEQLKKEFEFTIVEF